MSLKGSGYPYSVRQSRTVLLVRWGVLLPSYIMTQNIMKKNWHSTFNVCFSSSEVICKDKILRLRWEKPWSSVFVPFFFLLFFSIKRRKWYLWGEDRISVQSEMNSELQWQTVQVLIRQLLSDLDLHCLLRFLAHLAHWWAYSIAMVGRPSVIVRQSVVHHFQRFSSPKPLGLSKPNFTWSLSGIGERKFVHGDWVTWPRWPPRPSKIFFSRTKGPMTLWLGDWGPS